MDKMVSVIIPCYNHGTYIREAIDSVKAQTLQDLEIIIVNDGSDDNETLSVLQDLHRSGLQVINLQNGGVSIARNMGIRVARGAYILPLDADDKIGSHYLEEAVAVLAANPAVKLVYSECEYFGTESGITDLPEFSMKGMLDQNLIFNAAVFRKVDFMRTEGYDPQFLTGWEDWEFWLRFLHSNQEAYKLPRTHFFYRRKAISRNTDLIAEKLQHCEQLLYKKHIDLFLTINPNPLGLIKEHDFFRKEYFKIQTYREELLQSKSYRLGHLLLSPFKSIKKLLNG